MLDDFEIIPINCIWEEPDTLIQKIKQLRERSGSYNWVYSRPPLDLKRICLPAPPKGGIHLPQFTVWQPENMLFGSVLIPNYRDGLIQLMRHLNKQFEIQYFSAFLSKDYKKEGFCTFTHSINCGEKRVVQVIRDPKWKFFESGRILPYENIVHYRQRIISNRLSPVIIQEYLDSLGWNLDSEKFWRSKGPSWFAAQSSFA